MQANSVPCLLPEEAAQIRTALGMTRAEFAALLGITEKTISDRETGRKPVNLQATLAMEFVVASRTMPALRETLERHLCRAEVIRKAAPSVLPA